MLYRGPEERSGVSVGVLRGTSYVTVQSQTICSVDDEVGIVTNLLESPLVVVGRGHGIPQEGVWVRGSNLRNVDVSIESLVGSVSNNVEPVTLSVLDVPLVVVGRWYGSPQERSWVTTVELRSTTSVAV